MAELHGIVKGMDCASCQTKIVKNLEKTLGVKSVKLSLVSTKIKIEYDEKQLDDKVLKKNIKKMGYEYKADYKRSGFFNLKENKKIIYALIGTFFLTLTLISKFTSFPEFSIKLIPNFPIPIFPLITILIGGIPVFVHAFASIRALTIDIDLLMVIAIFGAALIGEWEEAAEIVILFSVAELIEAYTLDKARNSIRELMDLTPPTAIKLIKGKKHSVVPVENLIVGDRISVKPGGKIPVDGKIEWGSSNIDQSTITGESKPSEKRVGDKVFAGTINLEGYLIIRATSMYNETTLSRIIKLVEDAESKKAKAEQFVQVFAKYYTPIMVLVAILITFIPVVIFSQDFNVWIYRSLVTLVVACPCALVLSTPITVITAITRASKRGALIKGGQYLEALSKISVLAIDKTGTLTLGKLKVYKVEALNKFPEEELLIISKNLEKHSEHLIAKAIVNYCDEKNIGDLAFDEVQIFAGKGIKGVIGDDQYYIGNSTLALEVIRDNIHLDCDETESVVSYVIKNKSVVGHFHLSDELRKESKSVINYIKKAGIDNIYMLTGDNAEIASTIARDLKIDYHAELLPENKIEIVEKLRSEHGSIAFIGDGINDAPALATADVSIAMAHSDTAVAIETADIVLASNDLGVLPYLFVLSTQTRNTIKINIAVSLIIKLVFFILVFFDITQLWMAVLFGDMGASLLVILNAMRVGRQKIFLS